MLCVPAQSCLILYDPIGHCLSGFLFMEFSMTRILEQVAIFSPQDLPDSGVELVLFVSPASGSSNQR